MRERRGKENTGFAKFVRKLAVNTEKPPLLRFVIESATFEVM